MFRLATALFIAAMLLPNSDLGNRTTIIGAGQATTIEVSALDGLSAAKSIYDDLSGFCERNHETCVTGKALIGQLETKAREGLVMLSDGPAEKQPTNPDEILTGSIEQ